MFDSLPVPVQGLSFLGALEVCVPCVPCALASSPQLPPATRKVPWGPHRRPRGGHAGVGRLLVLRAMRLVCGGAGTSSAGRGGSCSLCGAGPPQVAQRGTLHRCEGPGTMVVEHSLRYPRLTSQRSSGGCRVGEHQGGSLPCLRWGDHTRVVPAVNGNVIKGRSGPRASREPQSPCRPCCCHRGWGRLVRLPARLCRDLGHGGEPGEPLPWSLPTPCLGWGSPWHHVVSPAGVVGAGTNSWAGMLGWGGQPCGSEAVGLQLLLAGAGAGVGWGWCRCRLGCRRWLEAVGGLRGETEQGRGRARQDWGRLGGAME